MTFRIASFNVENLFQRAAILNLRDQAQSDALLKKVAKLQALLDRKTYTDALRDEVFQLSSELVRYIDFRKDAGTLGDWKKSTDGSTTGFVIAKSATGRDSWLGQLIFRVQQFDDVQRRNTGKVVTTVNADLMCAIEVEGMDVLRQFNSQVLKTHRYRQFVMIDSPNDPRGIDVACLTKHRITGLRTHVFDAGKLFDPVFSRDCLEVALDIGQAQTLYVLCNHFKSQRGMNQAERDKSAAKRLDQSSRVSAILAETYDLTKDWVVVLGDLNEDSANPYQSLKPLFDHPNLAPAVDPSTPIEERYSYYYGGAKKGERFSQLDYVFMSKPLRDRMTAVGHERRGIAEIDKATEKEGIGIVKPFPSVTTWDTGASDHAALWVDLDF